MIFQFEHVQLWASSAETGIDLVKLKQTLSRWQKGLENIGWNALYVENHDLTRIVSKWGDAQHYWNESATAIATMYRITSYNVCYTKLLRLTYSSTRTSGFSPGPGSAT